MVVLCSSLSCQINYVSNGSFETLLDFNSPFLEYKAMGWSGVDSTKITAPLFHTTYGNVPYTNVGYQNPNHGSGFILLSLFCTTCPQDFSRSNVKNRLLWPLKNSTYCVKMFVNMQHQCPQAIDGFGMYFGNVEIDTIKYNARLPLTFLTPQVSNPINNIVNDTANWIAISGTFVANGGEKYLVIGNFKSDVATNTVQAVSGYTSNLTYSEYFIDAVSCVELDNNYIGHDSTLLSGDSLFIGKTNDDDWIDAKFTWFKLPSATPISTLTGFWVKPVGTETYIVKQEICSYTIWDTIVIGIKVDDTRLAKMRSESLRIYPSPVTDRLTIKVENSRWYEDFKNITISDRLGRMVYQSAVSLGDAEIQLDVSGLPDGLYFIDLRGEGVETIARRFVVRR
jgi:hypothetical protein